MYACTVVGVVVVVVVERLLRGQKKKEEKEKCEQMLMERGNKCLYKRFCCREPVIEVTFSL